jgi:hypothetical protein
MLLCVNTLQIRKAVGYKTGEQVKLDRTDRQTDRHANVLALYYYDVSKPGNLAFNCLHTWNRLLFIT